MRLSICLAFLATSSLCTAMAIPAWTVILHKFHNRQANSTTSAAGSTYTVAAGDTLNSIAAAAGVSEPSLEAANPGVAATDLQVGEILDIPTSSANTTTSNSTDALTARESIVGDASEDSTSAAYASGSLNHPANGTSGCGGGAHHHNGTAGAHQAHNETGTAGLHGDNSTHHAHNGTGHRQHNGTLLSGQGECNASDHRHHQNGTSATGTTGTGTAAAAHHHDHNGTASAGPVGTGIANAAPPVPGVNGAIGAGNDTHHHHHHHHNGTSGTGTPAAGTFAIPTATVLTAALTASGSV